jgi:hypothetical protein
LYKENAMNVFLSAALALGVILAPISSVMAQDAKVGVGPVKIQVAGNHDSGGHGDRDRNCHMVIVKTHHNGMEVTKRIRHCG